MMNTIKKMIALLLALAAVMGLAACGGPSTTIPDGALFFSYLFVNFR